MPMARSAVLVCRSTADMLNSTLGLAVMLACGLLVGWRWHASGGEAPLAVGLLLLLRLALLWLGIYLGLLAKNPEAVAAVQILVRPLAFLSNAFVATATMPGWLGVIAEWNPLSATVSATRELFGNPGWGGDSWFAQHAMTSTTRAPRERRTAELDLFRLYLDQHRARRPAMGPGSAATC